MKYDRVPQTDLMLSAICLGTASFGSSINKEESFRMLDLFVELGGNFLDTSLNYADWQCDIKSISEKTIGEWAKLRKQSGKIIIGTKGACPHQDRFLRLSREDILHDLHNSLMNLQTDCIELYWLHRDDPTQPVELIIDVLQEQVEAGKIRYFACSNWTVGRIEEAKRYSDKTGKLGFCANQPMWSLAQPNMELLMVDPTIVVMDDQTKEYHASTNMAVVPFSSQAGGFFSGQYTRNELAVDKMAAKIRDYGSDLNFDRLRRAQEVAVQLNTTSSVVALAYLLAHPYPVFPIIGSRTEAQLVESSKAAELKLDPSLGSYIETGKTVR